jgi:hypothetical protein
MGLTRLSTACCGTSSIRRPSRWDRRSGAGGVRRLEGVGIGWHWFGLASSAQWLALAGQGSAHLRRWTGGWAPRPGSLPTGVWGTSGAFDYPCADWRAYQGLGQSVAGKIRSPNDSPDSGGAKSCQLIPARPLPLLQRREHLPPLGGYHLAVRTLCPAPAGRSGHPECRPECQAHGRDCGQRQLVGPGSSLLYLY